MRMPAYLGSGESPLVGYRLLVVPSHGQEKERERARVRACMSSPQGSSIRACIPFMSILSS